MGPPLAATVPTYRARFTGELDSLAGVLDCIETALR